LVPVEITNLPAALHPRQEEVFQLSSETKLSQAIRSTNVAKGHVSCWWLGGSGFVFKTAQGTVVYLDAYLSDAVKGIFGAERAFAPPIDPEEVRADAFIATHWHEDHLDPGLIPIVARNNPHAKFIMPPSATAHALSWGVPRSQVAGLKWGETLKIADVIIEATPARHEANIPGWEVPDAMGVLLNLDQLTIYHCGDTEYDVRLRRLKSRHPDVALLCINGITGNMDAHEAALLAWQLGAGIVVPIHHFLWAVTTGSAEETLDPKLFASTYRHLGGTGQAVIPTLGEEIDLSATRQLQDPVQA
jgi:L-ascorbate metabolism protein UlaG (beta-lactamase superfamily)